VYVQWFVSVEGECSERAWCVVYVQWFVSVEGECSESVVCSVCAVVSVLMWHVQCLTLL